MRVPRARGNARAWLRTAVPMRVAFTYRRYSRRTADRYIFSGNQRRNFTM